MGQEQYIDPYYRHIVYFTGLDRVGKTTARKAFAKATGEVNITFDRSFADNLVYDKMFRGAEFSEEYIRLYMYRFAKLLNVSIVYMTLDFDEINKRYKATEGGTYEIKELELADKLFRQYLKIASSCSINVVNVDCNGKTTDEIVDEVVNAVKKGG